MSVNIPAGSEYSASAATLASLLSQGATELQLTIGGIVFSVPAGVLQQALAGLQPGENLRFVLGPDGKLLIYAGLGTKPVAEVALKPEQPANMTNSVTLESGGRRGQAFLTAGLDIDGADFAGSVPIRN